MDQAAKNKPKGRPKKSSFYHTRWNKVGLNVERAAELLEVSTEQVMEWDIEGAPAMAEKLLLLWDRKHVGYAGWEGFSFSQEVLIYKKKRWRPENLLEHERTLRQLYDIEGKIWRFYRWNGFLGTGTVAF
jgi:hypothetical protein